MKVIYDPEVDIVRIIFNQVQIQESDEVEAGLILDYDREGNVVGLEIMDASKKMENPRSVEYSVREAASVSA
ncbi:MAG: DUF2283 domain-containing protein [Hormoscilla sp. SP5CHS1]|nr:DUF2283 domain-containing protein [Hormoscilla sp. SP12CHS1]MBC6455095.1 DUF2283 domain-containing protein [Hormoscilla sp. SP5CHS1]